MVGTDGIEPTTTGLQPAALPTELSTLENKYREYILLTKDSYIFRYLAEYFYTGAGRENRTLILSLEGSNNTIILHPRYWWR